MVQFVKSDLQFILDQIKIAERHAAGEDLATILQDPLLSFGLRTVDGSYNNLFTGNSELGASDNTFPRMTTPVFRNEGDDPAFAGVGNNNYGTGGSVVDADPRIISNLVVDMTARNPAAMEAAGVDRFTAKAVFAPTTFADPGDEIRFTIRVDGGQPHTVIINQAAVQAVGDHDTVLDSAAELEAILGDKGVTGITVSVVEGKLVIASASATGSVAVYDYGKTDANGNSPDNTGLVAANDAFFIPNVTPDAGLSPPFNSWMTLFGQFFDHGLDLVKKGGNGTIFVPLQADDPLIAGADGTFGTPDDLPAQLRFMALTRTTPAPGGGETNTTTAFVDQNQTYTSHPSHQVFLREYVLVNNRPVATGKMLDGANGGLPTWAEVKAQAANVLGIQLDDHDAVRVPLVRTDAYGKFIPAANGLPQLITGTGQDGILNTADDQVSVGTLGGSLAIASNALGTNHAFLVDIAQSANPFNDAGIPLLADGPAVDGLTPNGIGDDHVSTTFDNGLLNAHFITGDGRGNENIGLTSVHFVFHAEHNRLVEHTKTVLIQDAIASNDLTFLNQWLAPTNQLTSLTQIDSPAEQAALIANEAGWNGERIFQAARFGTEMQYQHLVFEEFARTVQPEVNVFAGYNAEVDPSIVAEFAHTVYRFGHSMLTETIDRYDPDFSLVGSDTQQLGLIAAFLNPLEFVDSGNTQAEAAGAIVRGMTRQVGNEIDEFVTDALRNNLLGLPLDLPAINMMRGRDTGIPSLNQARREFYAGTHDSQLKPYESWVDFVQNVKHPLSVVNFIAAYGAHHLITDETTIEGKRAAALVIVTGTDQTLSDGRVIHALPAQERLDFLNSTGTFANTAGGVTVTGVDAIDFWIGGLAEKQSPFGGLLGSTFNFVFETQLEHLQDGDRLYYLERTAGLNFIQELENNTFASLIMRNTNTTHLPAQVFQTPAYILEVDQSKQFNDGLGGADPVATDPSNPFAGLVPLVVRDNPATPGADAHFLQYTGSEVVVLGGTDSNDTLIAGASDFDTVYGDGGNDIIEGGAGDDFLEGGDGNDIITDEFGNDVIKGGEGNDVINPGPGPLDIVIGGGGHDFMVGGRDPKELFAGLGNDLVMGGDAAMAATLGEGHDWFEGSPEGDVVNGDNANAFLLGTLIGNDIMFGGGGPDDLHAEGGDDIMLGGAEVDFLEGMIGFDWASYQNETAGVVADMNVVFIPIPPQPGQQVSTLDNFLTTEALSGSAFGDTLLGDDLTQVDLQANGGVLSGADRINLISGLQAILGAGVTSFDGGNIILGGGGSDRITGRGGNDIIDGDAWLNVQLQVGSTRYNSMTELQAAAFAGTLDPGDISIVREILHSNTPTDVDTAVFSGNMGDYSLGFGGTGGTFDGAITVTDLRGIDGTDTLRNIERLQFADQLVVLSENGNVLPTGLLAISGTPTQGQTLTASVGTVLDLNNPGGFVTPTIYFWQVANPLNPIVFTDVAVNGTGPTFIVTAAEAGQILRVRAQYTDANGVTEEVFSAPTAVVANINDLPVGTVTISDTTPTEGQLLRAANAFSDADGITLVGPDATVFSYQWQVSANGTNGWTAIAGATTDSFTPAQGQAGQFLRVVVTYTDNLGTLETVTSAATGSVTAAIRGTAAAETLNGNAADNTILGLAANDTLNGNTGHDLLNGGAGFDTLNGGAGNDTFLFTIGETIDVYNGGTGTDTLNIQGRANINDALSVVWNGTAITGFTGASTVSSVEQIVLDLKTGADTLSYSTSTAAVNVNLAGTASGFVVISGVENATGGSGADTLIGNAVANILNGGAGNDRITGGAGNDTMDGGLGNDTFFFGAGFGVDRITGFDANATGGQDLLNVQAMGITAAEFASRVSIAVVGADTQLTIDGNIITVAGVNGVGANAITQADFILL
jgi:Ca2+-binding RTX toxin-like protein